MRWQRRIVRYFLPFIKPDRRGVFALCFLSLCTTAGSALLIWLLGQAVSRIAAGEFARLNETLLLIAVVVLARQCLQWIYTYTHQRITLNFVDRVRGRILEHVLQLSFPVLNRLQKGDIMARLTGDVDRLLAYVLNLPLSVFTSVAVLTVYGAVLFWIDWRLALVAAAMAPLFFLSQRFVAPRAGEASTHFTRERARLLTIEEQALGNLRAISSFNAHGAIRTAHQRQFDTARRWAYRLRRIRMVYNGLFTVLLYGAGVILVFRGVASIQSDQLAIGAMVSFLIYLRYLAGPVRNLARIPIRLQTNRAAAERIMEILEMAPTVDDDAGAPPLQVPRGTVEFRRVWFRYRGDQPYVLKGVTETIHGGESVALVGPSGAGKSTLAALLLRFFDPQQGAIAIDGTDIRTVSLASLRSQVSMVWQEPFLINASIRDNLRLARNDASDDEMVAACRNSQCWEFVSGFRHGLDTLIGTSGIQLSAGQRQRLAIAQAFLRDSPVLVLDEASSALDSLSERMIIEALQSLRRQRTTLIIAHRFASIRQADRILYFNGDGSVTAGSHDQLMESHVDYRAAVDWQISRP